MSRPPPADLRVHTLKTWPTEFRAVIDGSKRFELRRNDRGFAVGDVLMLREWSPDAGVFTGRQVSVRVLYVLDQPASRLAGLEPAYCVLSIGPLGAR